MQVCTTYAQLNLQVIWSEHKRDYNPLTITSQFNDAHVIIYPLPSGLFRIQIFRKEKVGPVEAFFKIPGLAFWSFARRNGYMQANASILGPPNGDQWYPSL